MSNEFIARNGLIALSNTTITGSLTVTGSQILVPSGSTIPYSFIDSPTSGFTKGVDGALVFVLGGASVLAIYGSSWRFGSNITMTDAGTGNAFLGFRSGNQVGNSPTNFLRIQNATTGSAPKLLSDSTILNDVSLDLAAKGTGSVNFTTGSVNITSTTTATGSIARTMLISSSLSASANNDVLVGLDINPSFNTGSLTGVTKNIVRINSNDTSTVSTRIYTPSGVGANALEVYNNNILGGRITYAGTFSTDVYYNLSGANRISFNSNLGLYLNGIQGLQVFQSTNNVVIQNGGTFTDNGYRLQINASGSDSGSLFVGGTTVATGSIARTMLISSSLSASANNDILIGLDINPTFTNGSFTGVENWGIRSFSPIVPAVHNAITLGRYGRNWSTSYISIVNGGNTNLSLGSETSNILFKNGSGLGTTYAQMFNTTGNWVFQNGGTFTDNGFRLDISGSVRTQGLAYFGTGSTRYLDATLIDPLWNSGLRIVGSTWAATTSGQRMGVGFYQTPSARLHVQGEGATSATTTFLLQNSTPTTLMTVLDNGQYIYSGPLLTLASSQSAYVISQSISSSNVIGGQVYGVNITPTFYQTTTSQTETAFRIAATFTQSSATPLSGSNIIADFGATSVGSQLTITDVTSGSIYMVNDVSGLPIIEATSDWTVNMYNFPTKVFQKTGSSVIISGSLVMAPTSSFVFPLTSSTSPLTGSAYWSGSFLFVWDGSRYRSSSFA